MSAKFYQMQAEVLAPIDKPPTPTCIYLVAAWDGSGWSIRRKNVFEEFPTLEKATEYAKSLSPQWSNRTIIKIDLPTKE